MIGDVVKTAIVMFAVVLVQVSMISASLLFGAGPDLVLVTLLAIALLRGSIFGAVTGFATGLLLDIAHLGTLGFTSLLLTLAGFWIGRYGETTARDRLHAPYTSVAVVTVLFSLGALTLHFVLGDPAPAREVIAALPASVVMNLLLTLPVYALVRRLLPPREMYARVHQVRLVSSTASR